MSKTCVDEMRFQASHETVIESASAGVIDAINVIGNNTINRKCNWKSGETRPTKVGLYRTPKKEENTKRNKPTKSYKNF